MLFLAGARGYYEKRGKLTRRYLQDTAVSLKKGDFNTPSVFLFFKRKRRSEICYFKTAVRLLYFVLAHEYPATETTVFLFPLGGYILIVKFTENLLRDAVLLLLFQ